MGDTNPIRNLGDYSKPSHEGYRNTIELPVGNNVVPLRSDTIRLVQNGCSFHGLSPIPQPQALGTTFEARVRDYMAAHIERMERFGNPIFKQGEEINDKMAEMVGLLKELTTSMAPEKVLIREETKSPVTKNVNSISLTRGEEERNDDNDVVTDDDIKNYRNRNRERDILKEESCKSEFAEVRYEMWECILRLQLEWDTATTV
ncbi:hypothetical protein Tco_1135822 [Tanacetum coccineum]